MRSDQIRGGTVAAASIRTARGTRRARAVILSMILSGCGFVPSFAQTASTNPAAPISVTLNFYADNSSEIIASRPLTLDGPTSTISQQQIDVGTGASSYTGTLMSGGYIVPLTMSIVVTTSAGVESFDDDGNGTYVAWFDNGLPSEAGKYKDFKKFGKWIYYHKNGKPSSVELYDDTLKSFQYYNK